MRRTVFDSEKAIAAAIQAATAATRQADIAEATAKRQLRAYVSGRPDFMFAFDAGGHLVGKAVVTNHGLTLAHDLQARASIVLLQTPLTKGSKLPALIGDFGNPHSVFPGDPVNVSDWSAQQVTTADIASIRSGAAVICIYGEIKYVDVFGDKQWSQYCRFANADAATIAKLSSGYAKDDLKIDYVVAPFWNEAS